MRYLAIVFAITTLSSCSGPLYVTLYNNSEMQFRAVALEAEISIQPGETETFSIVCGIKAYLDEEFVEYSHPTIPGEYYILHKVFWHRIKLQLQPDGALLILKRNDSYPASAILPQPDSFPLEPMELLSSQALHYDGSKPVASTTTGIQAPDTGCIRARSVGITCSTQTILTASSLVTLGT